MGVSFLSGIPDKVAEYCQEVYSLAWVGYDLVIGFLENNIRGQEANSLRITSGEVKDARPEDLQVILQNNARPVVIDMEY